MAALQDAQPATQQPQLKDPSGLWRWFRPMVAAALVITIVLGAGNAGYLLLGVEISDETLWLDLVTGLAGLASLAVYLTCIVLTLRITHRMMRNVHAIGSRHAQISPRWAAGWYFIPFANLVMPARAVGQIWRGTFEAIGQEGKDSGVIGWWWGTWILGNIVSNIELRMTMQAGGFNPAGPLDQELMRSALSVGLAGSVLSALSCLFFLSVFGQLARAQTNLIRTSAFA
jgi:hypothetical protein